MKHLFFAAILLLAICNPLQAQYLKTGYRGMVEAGFGAGNSFDRSIYDPDNRPIGLHLETSTSHGYQFNPYLFLGGGVGALFRSFSEDGGTFPFFCRLQGKL